MDRNDGRTKYVLRGEGAGAVFVIDEKTGNIHVTKPLDREEKDEYRLIATATDRLTDRALEPSSQFIIRVQDINDNPPIFDEGPYSATVPEMANIGTAGASVCFCPVTPHPLLFYRSQSAARCFLPRPRVHSPVCCSTFTSSLLNKSAVAVAFGATLFPPGANCLNVFLSSASEIAVAGLSVTRGRTASNRQLAAEVLELFFLKTQHLVALWREIIEIASRRFPR